MYLNILLALSLITSLITAMDLLLSSSQKEAMEKNIIGAWLWLITRIELLKSLYQRLYPKTAAQPRSQDYMDRWEYIFAKGISVRAFWRHLLLFIGGVIILYIVADLIDSVVKGDVTALAEVPQNAPMFLHVLLYILEAILLLILGLGFIFLPTVGVPLTLFYGFLVILYCLYALLRGSEIVMRRIAENQKGPIVAIGLLLSAVIAALKAFS